MRYDGCDDDLRGLDGFGWEVGVWMDRMDGLFCFFFSGRRTGFGAGGSLLLWTYPSLMYCCVQIRVKNDNADNVICHVIVLGFGWTLTIEV